MSRGSYGQALYCQTEEANNGVPVYPVWTAGDDHYTQAKQWDTECWACRGVAPGS